MARPTCMVDVWDTNYQELLILAHAQDTQVVAQASCEDKFVTGADIIAQNKSKYEIK